MSETNHPGLSTPSRNSVTMRAISGPATIHTVESLLDGWICRKVRMASSVFKINSQNLNWTLVPLRSRDQASRVVSVPPLTVFCPGFQKGRVPSEKGILAR